MGMVTCLHNNHFQVVCSVISTLHSTWHTVCNQPQGQAKDIQVMGHSGKDKTTIKVVMVGLECSPLCGFQNMGCHLQVHQECLQDGQKTIQSIGQHLTAQIIHLNLLPGCQRDPRLASQWNGSSHLRNLGKQMSQGLKTCIHCQRCPTMIKIRMIRARISWTWAVWRVIRQSSRSKPTSPWSNMPNRWSRSTTAFSLSGRKYMWLGFWRRSIGPVSGGSTVWNRFEMDPCTGIQQLQIVCRHSGTGCHWIISRMVNRFACCGSRCYRRNVQAKLGRQGKKTGEATHGQWQIWVSVSPTWREVTSPSC